VLGKGAAFARAEEPIRALIEWYDSLVVPESICYSQMYDPQYSHTLRTYTHG
jgi:hypothetical protein